MTKKELVDYILHSKIEMEECKSDIKKLQSNAKEESIELDKLMVEVEERRKFLRDISNDIANFEKWMREELATVRDYIQKFGKGVPCAIEYEGKLIVVSNSDITIEENFIA